MVKKTHSATAHKRKSNTKHVTVHPHHAIPYRKRHIGLLLLSLTGLITVAILVFQYRDQVMTGIASSRSYISDMFQPVDSLATTLESTNGFSLTVDQQKLYAVAVDGFSGTLYQGESLSQKRAYSKVQIATSSTARFKDSQSAVTMTYHSDAKQGLAGNELSNLALSSAGINRKNVDFVRTQQVTIGGQTFEQSIWRTKQTDGPVKNLRASFSTYAADINGHPFTITVSEGVSGEPGKHSQFNEVIQSLNFSKSVVQASAQKVVHASHSTQSIMDTLMMANIASAASPQVTDGPEKIAALYGPAVAKIYNIYCMDLVVGGRSFVSNFCDGGTGSGFFVSQDGYFATNGHVAAVTPKDVAIYYAYLSLAVTGTSDYIDYLFTLAGGKQSDYAGMTDEKEMVDKLISQLYEIDDAKFEKRNDVQNMFVVLGEKQPSSEELSKDTTNRQKFALDATWKPVTLIASDFRLLDGIKSFHASDVAIVKVEGSNFPVARLGGIDDVTQGASMSILGFPGKASQNGLVESKTTTATLTTGKVSSKKNAAGSEKRLIETDTTIGHGNSGGPAFSDEGSVIGIATYTSDGAGEGDGTYNYVRDIKDLQDLAAKNSIVFNTGSETQNEWEEGMAFFYESRYSKALLNFEKVKQLYPNHNKVAEFIATANKRIANGEDVVDFPVIPIVIASVVLVIGLGAGIFLIVRHKKHHSVYVAGVAQGSVVPGLAQTVTVSSGPTVQTMITDPSPLISQPEQPAPPQALTTPPTAHQQYDASETELVAVESLDAVEAEEVAASTSQEQTGEFVQPVITTAPRTPVPFSVPARTDTALQTTRPSVSAQNNNRV